ncbi:hypothetical protein [Desulforhopalus singaporensis]|uniref:Uncharacterized protein n=1 Tax=Desulforhopalus singaporensis TaxID=91360 RepID=A0A1H0T4N2_9BACT|nr:hypothetical protein [Desulforhopalus singaporensis]SDP48496.1 hypothetical protein SAMN05660330_02907 [Desulforhopalus singaporensis]
MSHFKLLCGTILILMLITGCSPTYFYNDQSFSDPDVAYEEQHKHLENIIEQITPIIKPLYKDALVILPDYAAINNKSVKKTRLSSPEIVEYVSRTTQADLQFMVNSLKKYNLFKQLTIKESGNPQKTAIGKVDRYDAVIFYKLHNVNDQNWQLITQKTPHPIDLLIDETKEAGIVRTQQWLKDLQSALNKY